MTDILALACFGYCIIYFIFNVGLGVFKQHKRDKILLKKMYRKSNDEELLGRRKRQNKFLYIEIAKPDDDLVSSIRSEDLDF